MLFVQVSLTDRYAGHHQSSEEFSTAGRSIKVRMRLLHELPVLTRCVP